MNYHYHLPRNHGGVKSLVRRGQLESPEAVSSSPCVSLHAIDLNRRLINFNRFDKQLAQGCSCASCGNAKCQKASIGNVSERTMDESLIAY